MDDLDHLRPGTPNWLKGIVLSELALVLLVAEIRAVVEVFQASGVGVAYMLVRGGLFVAPYGALIGAFGPMVTRHRAITLWAISLALLGASVLGIDLSLRGLRDLDHTGIEVVLSLLLLAAPVAVASALFARWTKERPPPLDLAAVVDTFE